MKQIDLPFLIINPCNSVKLPLFLLILLPFFVSSSFTPTSKEFNTNGIASICFPYIRLMFIRSDTWLATLVGIEYQIHSQNIKNNEKFSK